MQIPSCPGAHPVTEGTPQAEAPQLASWALPPGSGMVPAVSIPSDPQSHLHGWRSGHSAPSLKEISTLRSLCDDLLVKRVWSLVQALHEAQLSEDTGGRGPILYGGCLSPWFTSSVRITSSIYTSTWPSFTRKSRWHPMTTTSLS